MSSSAAFVGSPQYAPAASVPLIKSPSLYLPRPIELPPDIHPLPEDISAYFVYPFTLEPHVLEHSPAHRAQAHASQAAHVALLLRRETERHERERKERMRLAPGWAGGQGLVPVRKATAVGAAGGGADAAPSMAAAGAAPAGQAVEEPKESSLEDDLRSLALGSSGAAAPEPSLATKAADDLGGAGVLL